MSFTVSYTVPAAPDENSLERAETITDWIGAFSTLDDAVTAARALRKASCITETVIRDAYGDTIEATRWERHPLIEGTLAA